MTTRFFLCLVSMLLAAAVAQAEPTPKRRVATGLAGKITQVVFSGDGKTLAVVADRQVKAFDVATGQEIAAWGGVRRTIVLSHDGRQLAVGTGDPQGREPEDAQIWDVSTGKLQKTLSMLPGHLLSLAFSPDGKSLALGMSWTDSDHVVQSRVKLFGVTSGAELAAYGERACADNLPGLIAVYGTALAFSPDGKTLAVGGNTGGGVDGDIIFWDVDSARQIGSGGAQCMSPDALQFSADGKTIASHCYQTMLWAVPSGKVVWTRPRDFGTNSLAFGEEGRLLLETGGEGASKYDIATGKVVSTTKAKLPLTRLSPDGKQLAYVDGAVVLLFEAAGYFDGLN